MSDEIFEVPCPTCQKPVPWTQESQFRPFCSKRCQLIDLGEWAAEEKPLQVILLILPWIPISVMNGVSNESSASR